MKLLRLYAALGAVAALAGCATYHSLPLASHPDLASAAASIAAPATGTVPGFDVWRVGTLAVARDPDLAAARAQVRVARAQAYAAGLLPDPTLSLALAHPFNGGAPSDHHNAWSAGLAENLVALLTRGDLHSAASAHYAETLLAWRWQAEQVALKAEVTYLNAWSAEREVRALHAEFAAARAALAAARAAHAAGALGAALYQQALQQAASLRSRLQSAADRNVLAHATLATMLRVRAGGSWHLRAPPALSAPAPASVAAALETLPRHRLDLLALRAGYRSADARLRADILAQFPILDLGFTRSRDNTGVNSVGFGVTLRLPLFNGNRGQIAIDRATRVALNAAYQAHLDAAANNVRAAYQRLRLARRQLAAVAAELPALARAAHASQQARGSGDVTRLEAFSALSAWLDARIDADRLRADSAQLALTLHTLLAVPQASSPNHGSPI